MIYMMLVLQQKSIYLWIFKQTKWCPNKNSPSLCMESQVGTKWDGAYIVDDIPVTCWCWGKPMKWKIPRGRSLNILIQLLKIIKINTINSYTIYWYGLVMRSKQKLANKTSLQYRSCTSDLCRLQLSKYNWDEHKPNLH